MAEPRPFSELADSGLLWLFNATVLHPRGFALAFHREGGEIVGWSLLGDGAEPWQYDTDDVTQRDIDDRFAAVEAMFAAARRK
jgi:hypothetical protein